MRSTARAAMIGSGVVGVSTLYHLAGKRWSDFSRALQDDRSPTSLSRAHPSMGRICVLSVHSRRPGQCLDARPALRETDGSIGDILHPDDGTRAMIAL
jgi:hypothetical protein